MKTVSACVGARQALAEIFAKRRPLGFTPIACFGLPFAESVVFKGEKVDEKVGAK